MITENICCNCRFYEGVKGAHGCAPCKVKRKITIWDDSCEKIWLIPERLTTMKPVSPDRFRPIECPNCGAPLRSENCEYCGSHIDLGTNFQIEIECRRLKEELEQKRCSIAQQSQMNQISTVLYANIVPFRVG